jgi:hypothetical protein
MPVSARHRARPSTPLRTWSWVAHPARSRRLGIVTAAARHLIPTMPWGTLLAGCAGGLAISVAAYQFAEPFRQPADITLTVRAAFVPLVAAVAFLLADPHRNLTASLPAPAWLTSAARLVLALPLLGLTAWLQFELAAAELGIDVRSQHLSAAQLPWAAVCAELLAWSAIALTAAALAARTRWHDLGGAIGAPAALAFIGLLAFTPLHLFPTAFTGLIPPQRSVWVHAEWNWWVIGLIAGLIACWASRDPWLRIPASASRLRSTE